MKTLLENLCSDVVKTTNIEYKTLDELINTDGLNNFEKIKIIDNCSNNVRNDIISSTCIKYMLSNTHFLRQYLLDFVNFSSSSSIPEKIEVCKSINNEDLLIDFANNKELDFVLRCSTIQYLIKHFPFNDNTMNILSSMVHYPLNVQVQDLFKFIKSLSNSKLYYLPTLFEFIKSIIQPISFKIISAQILIQSSYFVDSVLKYIVEYAIDDELDFNVRGDAADLLVNMENTYYRDIGRNVLIVLGGRGTRDIFSDAQNAHHVDIKNSTQTTLSWLKSSVPITTSMDSIKEQFINLHGKDHPYKTALLRIEFDSNVYGIERISLLQIFQHVYCFIKQQEEFQDFLFERLNDELIEMTDTCSTGHVSRLVNVLSGIVEGKGLSISFQEQIISNLKGRLVGIMKKCDNMDILLEEMIIDNLSLKSHFLKFFRENISFIREDMYKEFCHNEIDGRLITDCEFDEYFRMAIIRFTG
jgi:hypothetical protein